MGTHTRNRRALPSPTFSYRTPLDSTGLHWIPLESYRTFVGTTVSQHLKSYRTVFPQFLFKFGGLMVESSGLFHWTPLESTRVHQI